jgi:hypothetical protein
VPDSQPTAKMCTRCGQDCAGKPRTKDAQGRYTCKGCYDQVLAAQKQRGAAAGASSPRAAAAVAAPPLRAASRASAGRGGDEAALLAGLLDGAAVVEACLACGAPLSPGTVVCTGCGYNRRTGQRIATRSLKELRQERPSSGSPAAILLSPAMVGVGLVVLYVGALALALSDEILMPLGLLLIMVGTFATSLYRIVAAFIDGDTGWGICGVLAFVIPCVNLFLWIAMLYYGLAITARQRLKAATAAELLAIVLAFIMAAQHFAQLQEMMQQ